MEEGSSATDSVTDLTDGEGSSATDSVTDLTDGRGKRGEGRRGEADLMPHALCPIPNSLTT